MTTTQGNILTCNLSSSVSQVKLKCKAMQRFYVLISLLISLFNARINCYLGGWVHITTHKLIFVCWADFQHV